MKNKMHLISFSYLFLLFFTTFPKQAYSFQKNNLENKSNYLISNVPIEDKLIKTVTANGFGTSIESAARNAASNGLTQIVGSFIDAETIIKEKTKSLELYFRKKASQIPQIKKIKGRGLMLGLEFDFDVVNLRKILIHEQFIFTGGSSNKKLIRILPPMTIKEQHFDHFFDSLSRALKKNVQ